MANKKQKHIIDLPMAIRVELKRGLVKHGKVKVIGLGIFETREIPSRRGRNPQSGKIMMIPAYTKIKFRPTKSLKEMVC